MNVLLIEPDVQLAKVYEQFLTSQGHAVVIRHHAQDALHAADKVTPEVIVVELQLPSHSGIEFLYEFRSYPEWNSVPIVLHTVVPLNRLGELDNLKRSFGVTDYLYKPSTTLMQLKSCLERVT